MCVYIYTSIIYTYFERYEKIINIFKIIDVGLYRFAYVKEIKKKL